jgi:hypothetical protein
MLISLFVSKQFILNIVKKYSCSSLLSSYNPISILYSPVLLTKGIAKLKSDYLHHLI